jgi:hypothetical protein
VCSLTLDLSQFKFTYNDVVSEDADRLLSVEIEGVVVIAIAMV